jgi:hypothetical protein
MTKFLRLFNESDKSQALILSCTGFRNGETPTPLFDVDPDAFRQIPGAPFAYWVSEDVRSTFTQFPQILSYGVEGAVGAQTSNNFRFLRLWWEANPDSETCWTPYAKGGKYSQFYGPVNLLVRSKDNFDEIVAYANGAYPYLNGKARSLMHADDENFGDIGLTWTKSTTSPPSFRLLPKKASYSDTGPTAGGTAVDEGLLLSLAALMNSLPFKYLLTLSLGLAAEGRKHYEIGVVNKNPIPKLNSEDQSKFAEFSSRSWSLKRTLDTVFETSHSFQLPSALRTRLGDYDPAAIEAELADIQAKIDEIAFDLYGFSDADRAAALGSSGAADEGVSDAAEDADDSEDDDGAEAIDQTDGLLSWAAGVAFGRFDWRLATGERATPPEPDPFDPLPAKSPGMLPDGAAPFCAHSGILVDDQGHPNDLARLIEEVLACVNAPVPADVRRWLQRDFFPLHLKLYSKSRRKAPIYWPLSTSSGGYTLWLYYPSLTDQTFFTAVNDFIEPKLKQVGQDLAALRTKGSARSRDDEKTFEALQALELELIELRDTVLAIAQTYRPNHDDGVQITAAPLWQLFRHKPWQKVLKDTWAKLEKGDYDWAHLAMAYWPERVRQKCITDKSLAIAHGLEHLYVEAEPKPTMAGGRKKTGKE